MVLSASKQIIISKQDLQPDLASHQQTVHGQIPDVSGHAEVSCVGRVCVAGHPAVVTSTDAAFAIQVILGGMHSMIPCDSSGVTCRVIRIVHFSRGFAESTRTVLKALKPLSRPSLSHVPA